MQIELPETSWTAAPSPQDDAHTWTLPALLAAELGLSADLLVLGDPVRIAVAADVQPVITITF